MTTKGEQLLGCPGDAPVSPRAAAAFGKGKARAGRYSLGTSHSRIKRTGSIVGGPLMAVRYHNGPALEQLPRRRSAPTVTKEPPPTQPISKSAAAVKMVTGHADGPVTPSPAVAAALALPGQLARIPRENYVVLAYYNTVRCGI